MSERCFAQFVQKQVAATRQNSSSILLKEMAKKGAFFTDLEKKVACAYVHNLPCGQDNKQEHWDKFAKTFLYYRTGSAYYKWYMKNRRSLELVPCEEKYYTAFLTAIIHMYWNYPQHEGLWRYCNQQVQGSPNGENWEMMPTKFEVWCLDGRKVSFLDL